MNAGPRRPSFTARCLLALAALLAVHVAAWSQVCAAPGISGGLTIAGTNTVVNTYYAGGAAGGAAGTNSIAYSGSARLGGGPAIAAGDLVLIIQMQDGTGADSSNTASYNFPATAAGRYEFARVLAAAGTSLTLSANLANSYAQNTATANNQTYQVIRVPQYSVLTVNAGASVVPLPWDGTTGGVVAVDVAGAFTNNGSIDASFAGFRGNAGLTLGGFGGAAAENAGSFSRVRPDAYTAHGGKGEGIGGTPDRVLNVFSAAGTLLTAGTTSANGTATNAASSSATFSISGQAVYLNTTGRSYAGGSRAAGAPANAGGGGADSAPASNSENSGGGGGSSIAAGGVGGNTWNTNQAIGGRGGNAIAVSAGRIILGGGGGSGTSNDNYGTNTSGGAGGGLIIVKAGSVAGSGVLSVNGQAGRSIPTSGGQCPANSPSNCDGGGGGGGAGGVVVLASSGTVPSVVARGGQGGNIAGTIHGPGGGGSGGYLVYSSVLGLSANVFNGGMRGQQNVQGTASDYGASDGSAGSAVSVTNGSLPAAAGGLPAACLPALTTVKVTSTPAATSPIAPPGTTTYSIVVTNSASSGDARSVTLYEPLLPGGTATVANPPTPTATFSATPAVCALAARPTTADPANGATATWTASSFTLPGGCSLTYTFAVAIPATMPNGTYNNSAVAWFKDPSDSSGTRTVTAALPPAATGLTANTSFTTGGAVGGANYDGSLTANTGDNIRVQRQANLTITKTNGVASVTSGSSTSYTVTVANLGPNDAAGTTVFDPVAPGLSCTVVTCSASVANVCPASPSIANFQNPAVGLVLSPTFPSGASASFVVGCTVTATGS